MGTEAEQVDGAEQAEHVTRVKLMTKLEQVALVARVALVNSTTVEQMGLKKPRAEQKTTKAEQSIQDW